ncbi:MAG: hypothetical protein A3B23_00935 [Candidatus Colwellbacteria bacterium RIFCSPLOWO2_01_FULL_48_10]|uniref:DUF5671 domain-containing protein n=2 Tax=Bacteria candidate phyla TaxID=1783234 RepID=A0A1F5P3D2_9BACT|nr:MAG: hypothetical protein A2846_03975 [Candidatus Doudnabacteria bacterium RIFCSPHIGHO2_01_FULL_49_9]OGY59510.1 MAG: hypothetical protein A3B23_00935 [Candidatus Colwellbacteria bacterium RIFCSPLOWO2_01_FULL_48_10]
MTHPTEERIKSAPKDVFVYLLSIATLYTATINFITLIFGYIDIYFPNTLDYYGARNLGSIRWSIASIIIVFPVYLLTSWLINRDIKKEPARGEIKIRKWLIYLTLFIAAVVVIGDLITIIYNFLEGDLTARFALKTLAVLIVALAIFGYYIWELRHAGGSSLRKKAAIAAGIVIGTIVIAGFFIAGSPLEERLRKFDERRVNDLQSIQSQLINYWMSKGRLPANLDALTDNISGFRAPTDPETGTAYGYQPGGDLSFKLCADFKTDARQTSTSSGKPIPAGYYGEYGYSWDHEIGTTCFERTIDPELYPKRPKS